MALKVLMVGGRRCGKTSALATTFDMIINGPVKDYFTVADKTRYVTKSYNGKTEKQDVLSDKQLELKYLLEDPSDSQFLVDANPTYYQWNYKLELKIPGSTKKSMELEFTDVPGEWFTPGAGGTVDEESGRTIKDIITDLVRESDVYVIMVDTPNLMHPKESIAAATNAINGIQDYMTHVSEDSEKLVMLCPIKCEKWIKEGKMDQVVARVEKMYDTMLTALKAYKLVNICILPIETAGNILFFEHSDPTIISENPPVKCKKEAEGIARLGDGSIRFLTENDKINIDPLAVITGKLKRPYSWFIINDKATSKELYAPTNCDQIPLHILQFMLNKFKKGAFGGLLGMLFGMIFGTIAKEELDDRLNQLRNAGLIKEDVDNIKYIKRTF